MLFKVKANKKLTLMEFLFAVKIYFYFNYILKLYFKHAFFNMFPIDNNFIGLHKWIAIQNEI